MKIEKIGEIKKGISMILYADNGIGKTRCLGTLPAGEILVLDVEGGMWTLARSGHHVIRIESGLTNLKAVYHGILTGEVQYPTIGVDNFSAFEGQMLDSFKDERGKDYYEWAEYRNTNQKMREWIRLFRDLTESGINVVLTMWENWITVQNNADGVISRCVPRISERIEAEVCGLVDFVGHLEKDPKSDERYIRFTPNGLFKAKSRDNVLDELEDADLSKIFAKLRGQDG